MVQTDGWTDVRSRDYQKGLRTCAWSSAVKIGHFTVMDGSESGVDLVLIQTLLPHYPNEVFLMLTSIFQGQLP